MRKAKLTIGAALAVGMLVIGAGTAFAMPGDIEEAVNAGDYDSTQYQNGTATYEDSDLLAIGADYAATAYANIRTAPFGEIIGGTVPGQTYYVVGECPDCMWYKVSGEVGGYVYADYLVPQADYNAGTNSNTDSGYNVRPLDMKMTVDAVALNVRSAPSLDAQVLKSLSEGTEVHVTGKVANAEWYECDVDGQKVYLSDNYLKPELPQTLTCTVDALNIRVGAGADTEVIGTLRKGAKVEVTADENDWLKFAFSDGREGYVYSEYMAVV